MKNAYLDIKIQELSDIKKFADQIKEKDQQRQISREAALAAVQFIEHRLEVIVDEVRPYIVKCPEEERAKWFELLK